MKLRYPNITGKTPEERQNQLERFLRGMVDQLNMSMQKGGTSETAAKETAQGNDLIGILFMKVSSLLKQVEYLVKRIRKTPVNLLDNSDFRNPVNQRGQTTYTSDYGFDRWRIYASNTSMTKKDGYITITGSGIWQNVPNVGGKIYTFAGQKTDGTIYVCSGKFENGVATPGGELVFNFAATGFNSVMIGAGDWQWVALYEGEYTIDTLPEYQPKGYGVELAECQRYYREDMVLPVYQVSGSVYLLGHACQMRDMGGYIPSFTLKKFTKPDVIDITSFAPEDNIGVERLGNGTYLLSRAYLSSCSAYDIGMLRFNVSADL